MIGGRVSEIGLVGSPALEASGVSKVFGGGVSALAGIDLRLAAGTCIGLVGPNGAGKSTLIRSWIGFERPTRGSVATCGVDPQRDRNQVLRLAGYVPQTPTLYRDLTVAEHVELVGDLRPGFDRDLARRRLDQLGIALQHRAGNLSGGQRAQVYLALVIGLHPRVFLLDEPLASLDPLARREFLAVMTEAVQSDGATALLSSHVVGDVEQACDYLVVLGAGRVLLDAPIDAVLSTHVASRGAGAASEDAHEVGAFAAANGEKVHLLRTSAPGATAAAPATLEEVVLGYLAAGRDQSRSLSGADA